MTTLHFTKMHGLGNDFIVIDTINQSVHLTPDIIKSLCDRHRGIGCDQLLVVAPATHPEADFAYKIFNADGGEVEQCGNGARCFARFVRDKGLTEKQAICVETLAGLMTLHYQSDDHISVALGVPTLLFNDLKCDLEVDNDTLSVAGIRIGNPHAVWFVPHVETHQFHRIGRALQQHDAFPEGVNLSAVHVLDEHHIHLRVFERGVGETLACGSGACAAVVAGCLEGLLVSPVAVELLGGVAHVSWAGDQNPVILTGPAVTVFQGHIELA